APAQLSLTLQCAISLLFAMLAIAIYSNTFAAPFIFDGEKHIERNPAIRSLLPTAQSLMESPRILVTFTFAMNYAADGLNVRGYHAVNLAVHFACALVLFGIARRTLSRPPLDTRYRDSAIGLSLAIGLLWMVHPLATQSVTYLY